MTTPWTAGRPSDSSPPVGLSRRPATAYVFLAIVMLAWSGNSIVGRAVRDDIPPFTLAFVRWTGALLIMAPFVIKPVLRDAAAIGRHWRRIVILGLLGIACFNAFLYLGLHFTTATNTILIQAAIPPMILVANRLLFGETAPAVQIAGVVASTLGVVLVVCRADPQVLLHFRFSIGDLLVLIGVVGWSLYTALLRRRPPIDPRSFLAVTFAVGALAMLPLAAGEWLSGHAVVWRPATLAAFAYVAIFPSLIGYFLYNTGVAMIGAAKAGQTVTLMPLFGAFLAAALLGEPLHGYHLAGMALILVGIALSALSGRQRGR